MTKSLIFRYILIGFTAGMVVFGILVPEAINADLKNVSATINPSSLVKNGRLTVCKLDGKSYEVVRTIKMVVTAYSSTPDQTDDTPNITASNKRVQKGFVANNGLRFGTKVRIPELFGDEIKVVEDRMHERKGTRHLDVWFEDTQEAKNFGAKYNVTVEILDI